MKLNVLYAVFVLALVWSRSCEYIKQDRCSDGGGRWLKKEKQCQMKSSMTKADKIITVVTNKGPNHGSI